MDCKKVELLTNILKEISILKFRSVWKHFPTTQIQETRSSTSPSDDRWSGTRNTHGAETVEREKYGSGTGGQRQKTTPYSLRGVVCSRILLLSNREY